MESVPIPAEPDRIRCQDRAIACLYEVQTVGGGAECALWSSELSDANQPYRCVNAKGDEEFSLAEQDKVCQDNCGQGLNRQAWKFPGKCESKAIEGSLQLGKCDPFWKEREKQPEATKSRTSAIFSPGREIAQDIVARLSGEGELKLGGQSQKARIVDGLVELAVSDFLCETDCSLSVVNLEVSFDEFKLHDTVVHNLTLSLPLPINATRVARLPLTSFVAFVIPKETRITALGSVDGQPTIVEAATVADVASFYDVLTGQVYMSFTAEGEIGGHEFSADLAVVTTGVLNRPPSADAGESLTLTAEEDCMATVKLDASASHDPDGNLTDFIWHNGRELLGRGLQIEARLPKGIHEVSLIVVDSFGSRDIDSIAIEVIDKSAPVLKPVSQSALVSCGSSLLELSPPIVHDACDGDVVVRGELVSRGMEYIAPTALDENFRQTFGVGSNTVRWTAVDSAGNVVSLDQEFVVGSGVWANGKLEMADNTSVLGNDGKLLDVMNTGDILSVFGVGATV